MEMQSKKKIDETKAKDRRNGLQLVFQAVCFVLRFLLFLILSLFSLHFIGSLWDHFLVKFKRVAFGFNFYERNAFQCNRIRCGS